MTTQEMPATAGVSRVPAGWHVDPDDPHVMRWWDGHAWGTDLKPRLVVAAEDQTRIFNEQARLLAEIRRDVSSIRSIVVFWFVLTLLGLLGYIIVINSVQH
jgi:Protein of unknown function (DUF2510)